MSFWSDNTLRSNLNKVIYPPDQSKVDVSGYRLSVGDKVYVTKDTESNNNPVVIDLNLNNVIEIPPGQFALISTREKVTIPKDTIGFISIRARVKFRGLINVSGFHVDPGYSDHLIFSVFNAGPKAIPLQKGDDIFLIWFASLDQENGGIKKEGNLNGNIPSEYIGEINLQVNSTAALNNKFEKHIHEFLNLQAEVHSTREIRDSFNLFNKIWSWGLPVIGSILTVAILFVFGLLKWGVSHVNDLDVQLRVQKDKLEALEKLEADYKSLKLSIEELKKSESQKIFIDSQISRESQKQTLESINDRLIDIEKNMPSIKQK